MSEPMQWIHVQMRESLREKAKQMSEEKGLDSLSALVRYLIAQEWGRLHSAHDEQNPQEDLK